jgi:hypothetical protein
MNESPEELRSQREKRVCDAIELKVPDRIPIVPLFGYFPAIYKGVSIQECMYDYSLMKSTWSSVIEEFQPDLAENPVNIRGIGPLLEALDYKQLRWAGHGLNSNVSYQYVEKEYMKEDEYELYLNDPTDFILRTYWPRIMGIFKPFEKLPPLHDIISYYLGMAKFAFFDSKDILGSLESLGKAAAEASKMISNAIDFNEHIYNLGFPPQYGSMSHAPFDTVSDFMRGTRGTMLDMFRQPDKILRLVEKLLPMHLKMGLVAKARGVPRVFIPLHKGLDGFMSQEQFKKFWWPTLKKLVEGLIEGGCTPFLLWEGNVESRLEIIGDIPKGKAVYSFERTDMIKAKKILGDTVCIKGNVPLSILSTGNVDDVKTYCSELIKKVGKDGGFIMDSSTVLDEAKPENVKAMFEFTKEYGQYS